MEEHNGFLKHIYHEDLYIINEPAKTIDDEDETLLANNVNGAAMQGAPTESAVEEPRPVKYLGNNENGILLLVEDPNDELLNQNDLDLLMKIVESGLKYSKNDFALVNTAKFPVERALEEISYTYIISFGVDLSDFFSSTTMYTIHDVEGSRLLISDALSSMHYDNQKKGKLWLALKSMFNIS
jgi:hypothetical protein